MAGRKPWKVLDISPTPDRVLDQEGEYTVPPGETAYTLVLTDEQMDLLAQGIVPEAISQRAFVMLGWKRENKRVESRASGATS